MIDFLENFNWLAWFVCSVNTVLVLAVCHWFPWSFFLGRALSYYGAFLCGCTAVLWGFLVWGLIWGDLEAWLRLTGLMMGLHWPLFKFERIQTLSSRPKAYALASLPVLLAFAGVEIAGGDYGGPALLLGMYVFGGVATYGFYWLDKAGEHAALSRPYYEK